MKNNDILLRAGDGQKTGPRTGYGCSFGSRSAQATEQDGSCKFDSKIGHHGTDDDERKRGTRYGGACKTGMERKEEKPERGGRRGLI